MNIQIRAYQSKDAASAAQIWNEKKADIGFLSYQEPMPYEWTPLDYDEMLAVLPKDHLYASKESYPLINCDACLYDGTASPSVILDGGSTGIFTISQFHFSVIRLFITLIPSPFSIFAIVAKFSRVVK